MTSRRPQETAADSTDPRAAHATSPPLWLLGAAAALVAMFFGVQWLVLEGDLGFPLDDSWIHLQFARNLAAGDGLSYNAGEWVPGSTAPLWTALLALGFVLPGPAALWSQAAGALFHVLAVGASWSLARELDVPRGLASAVAGGGALTSWMLWGAVSGLEIPLFVWLTLLGMRRHLRERRQVGSPSVSLVIFALSALARPEGLMLIVIGVFDRLVFPLAGMSRRAAARSVAVAALPVAAILTSVVAFNLWTTGSVLPTTFAVKAGGGVGLLPSIERLNVLLSILFVPQPLATLAAVGGCLALAVRLGGDRDSGLLLPLWVIGLPLAYSAMGGPGGEVVAGNFGRYVFPVFLPMCVLAGVALVPLTDRLQSLPRAAQRLVSIGLAALWLGPGAMATIGMIETYSRNLANVRDSDIAAVEWLSTRVPPEAILAVNDIGALKYMLPNPVVDMAGIAHPRIGQLRVEAIAAGRPSTEGTMTFLSEERPDYLVIFPNWFPNLVRRSEFRPVHEIVIPDNITMGGPSLVIFETPWTRYPAMPAGPGASL